VRIFYWSVTACTTAKSESGKESPADRKKQKKKFLGIF